MNIYTLIGNVLVSSDKQKATLTPLEPRYPTAMVVALQLQYTIPFLIIISVVNHSYALIHTENSIPKPTDH